MKWEQQTKIVKQTMKELLDLLDRKGKEYTVGDADCLANFKRQAEDVGVRPDQIALVFMNKHWSSIKSYVKVGKEISDEPIEGRIHDLINYLLLLKCIIHEQKEQAKQSSDSAPPAE